MAAEETRFEELKRYVSFTEDDARTLASFGPVAASEFPRIAREFYDRIREHEEAHAALVGEDQIERLQRSLVAWMHRLCSGRYDESYFEETTKIGRRHVKVGLPQRYMFTAMALIRVALSRIAEERMGDLGQKTREALTRLLDVELAIMLEAYREDFVDRVQRIERLEKEELNRTLVRTEHRYMNAVELARALIIGLDARGDIRLFNRGAELLTGFARDEVFGKPFVQTILDESLAQVDGALVRDLLEGKAADRGNRATIRTLVRTRPGKYRDVRMELAYAPAAGDDDVVLFVVGNDTTEESALSERTHQSRTIASLGTLATGLAHEIRNPLNGAQLHIAFLDRSLRRSGASHEVMEAVQVVADEIARLANLVTSFLDFARPPPAKLKNISAFALCERAMQGISDKADDLGIALERELPTRDIQFRGDGGRLEQALSNMLRNALEAITPNGRGKVVLRARREPRSVVFEVEDNGAGLSHPEDPIFDPFFSNKPNATGLGLAVAQRVVTDHQGTITVEARPGRTVFRVALPLDVS